MKKINNDMEELGVVFLMTESGEELKLVGEGLTKTLRNRIV